jgi:polysaccharide biosynthesis protein PslH
MERAIVSTTSGCAGLGLVHGESAWIADNPETFAEGIAMLIGDRAKRQAMARRAREIAVRDFDWKAIGEKQRRLWRGLLKPG